MVVCEGDSGGDTEIRCRRDHKVQMSLLQLMYVGREYDDAKHYSARVWLNI